MDPLLADSQIMQRFPSIRYCYLSMKSFCEGKIREAERLYDKALEAAEAEMEQYGASHVCSSTQVLHSYNS